MNTVLTLCNAAACGLISAAMIFAILSPRVQDGVVIKAGLICMALGFGSIAIRLADELLWGLDAQGLQRSLLMVNAGLAVVVLGYVVRISRKGHSLRRTTDWTELHTDQIQWTDLPKETA